MKTTIRLATVDDEQAIIECIERAYSKYIELLGTKPAPMLEDYRPKIDAQHVYVIEGNTQLLGLVVLIANSDHLYLGCLAVDPSAQGKGIGRALMKFSESLAALNKLEEIRLFTNVAMVENVAIYLKYGYQEVERKLDQGYNRVYFSKRIETVASNLALE